MQIQAPPFIAAADAAPAFPLALPVGSFALDAALDDTLRRTCGAAPRRGEIAHPAVGFVAALGGAGLPVAEILARCGRSIDAGPLLAACEMDWATPLKVGKVYQVEGEVETLVRKPSRRFGAADHLRLRFTVALDASPCLHVRLHMIVPAA